MLSHYYKLQGNHLWIFSFEKHSNISSCLSFDVRCVEHIHIGQEANRTKQDILDQNPSPLICWFGSGMWTSVVTITSLLCQSYRDLHMHPLSTWGSLPGGVPNFSEVELRAGVFWQLPFYSANIANLRFLQKNNQFPNNISLVQHIN